MLIERLGEPNVDRPVVMGQAGRRYPTDWHRRPFESGCLDGCLAVGRGRESPSRNEGRSGVHQLVSEGGLELLAKAKHLDAP